MNNITPAAIYARYSSDNQRDASIEDQLRVCRSYADAHGLAVIREYCDHALTGRTEDRPAYLQMLSDAPARKFSVLLVYSMDRLGRDMYALAVAKHNLKRHGVSIIYVTQPLGEGPEATLMEAVLTGLSQYYSENLARSVRRGLEGNALKGIFTGSNPPLGYRLTADRHLVVDEQTAPIVREVFRRYAAGESVQRIITDFNARGLKTSRGNSYTANSLRPVLHNEVYVGTFHWGTVRTEHAVPPIITPELWARTQAALARNRIARARTKSPADFLLTGKAFCGKCGALLVGDSGTARNGTTHYYYTCANHKRGKKCAMKSVRKDALEALCFRAARQQLTPANIHAIAQAAAADLTARAKQSDTTPILKAELKQTETKIKNILTAIEAGIITDSTKQRLTELEASAAATRRALAKQSAAQPTITAEHFEYYLSKLAQLKEGADTLPQLVGAFVNSLTIFDDDEGNKKIVLVLNLKTNTTITLAGSDIDKLVGLITQNPNHAVIVRGCAVAVLVTLAA